MIVRIESNSRKETFLAMKNESQRRAVVPAHVACVMDGNGRWAEQQGLPRTRGHEAAEAALFDTIEGALDLGISWFTVYAFSTENWKRPRSEVEYLLTFTRALLNQRLHELNERNVRVRFIGRRGKPVRKTLLREMADAEALTQNNTRMTLSVAFNYGGRAEIVDAVRSLMSNGMGSEDANPLDITEEDIARHLYAPDMPDPDLVIRTSGESRISNFLLWQLAYSELVFFDVLWPDFRRDHLFQAVEEYQRRERRYGDICGQSSVNRHQQNRQ